MRYQIKYERQELFDVNMVITMILTINKAFSESEIEEAFRKAVGINEILNTGIVIESDGRAFYIDNESPMSFVRMTEEDFEIIRQREEKKRFRIEYGEYIRAYAKVKSNETSILLLMHHMAGDGKSALYFIEDFLTFLSGEKKGFKEIRTIETKPLVTHGRKAILSNLVSKYYNKRWTNHPFSFEDMDKAYERYWKDKSTKIETKILSKEQMDEILDGCHKAGTKFTSYLTASLIRNQKGKQKIGYATNYRHDGNRSMGNQASGISIKYKYNPLKSIYENASMIQRKLTKKLSEDASASYVLNFMSGLNPTLVDAVNLVHTGAYENKSVDGLAKMMGFNGKASDLSITNLTTADIPVRYGDFEIMELIFAGPVVSYSKNVISVVTCNGKTAITRHQVK